MNQRRLTGADSDLRAVKEVTNDLVAAFEALLTKLDSDSGVSDEDYSSTLGGLDTLG